MSDTLTVDLRGYQCPLPVLKTRNKLRAMAEGDRLWIHTDDPMAVVDIPHFCNEYDQVLSEQTQAEDGSSKFLIIRQGNKL